MNFFRNIIDKHLTKTILSLAVIAAAASCSDEMGFERAEIPTDGLAHINYEIDGVLQVTRSVPASEAECRLDDAYMMFFKDYDNSTEFVACEKLKLNANGTVSFSMPAKVTELKNHKVLIIGNPGYYKDIPSGISDYKEYVENVAWIEDGSEVKGRSYEWCRDNLQIGCDQSITSERNIPLPMYGILVNDENNEIPFSYSMDGVNCIINGHILFRRAVSRLDLLNLVSQSLDVRYVKVCNYQDDALPFADWKAPNDDKPITLEEKSDDPTDSHLGDYVKIDDGDGSSNQSVTSKLYAFHNMSTVPVINDKTTTCLILAGYYVDPKTGEKDEKLTYYRMNVATNDDAQFFKRNYRYRGVIKAVLERGKDTDKEAYDYNKPTLDVSIQDDWDVDDDNRVSDADGNMMLVSKTLISFAGAPVSSATIQVFTSPGMTWNFVAAEGQQGNQAERFKLEKLSDGNTLQISTVAENGAPGAVFGYYDIVATNTTTQKQIRKRLNLQQMSSASETILISVDGRTGTIEKDNVSGNGATLEFTVRTGSLGAGWKVSETRFETHSEATQDEKDNAWKNSGEVVVTQGGSDKSTLRVSLPAYMVAEDYKPRILYLKVEYSGNEGITEESEKVPPVYIIINQKPSDKWIFIDNPLTDGHLEIDAFNTEYQTDGNCAKTKLQIRLLDDSYLYKITSTFNPNNELFINGEPSTYLNYLGYYPSFSPTYSDTNRRSEKDDNSYNSVLNLYAYRTGPGDPVIKGSITVIAYKNGESPIDNGKNSISISVWITTPDCIIDDVIIPIEQSSNFGYLLIADRYVGCPPKKDINVAPYFTPDESIVIGGTTFNGIEGFDQEYDLRQSFKNSMKVYDTWDQCSAGIDTWKEDNAGSPENLYFYSADKLTGWRVLLPNDNSQTHNPPEFLFTAQYLINALNKSVLNNNKHFAFYSKTRIFLVSEFDKFVEGKKKKVCCWIQNIDKNDGAYTNFITSEKKMGNVAYTCSFLSGGISSSYNNTNLGIRPFRFCTYEEIVEYKENFLNNTVQDVVKYENCQKITE